MLMRFSISNFMSFEKEQEFSMFPGRVEKFKERVISLEDQNVLKFCALYGANAAGKSNLVNAIDIGKNIIVKGIAALQTKDMYCRNREINKDTDSKFEYEINIGEKRYAYGFEVNLFKQIVKKEWLYQLKNGKEIALFERVAETSQYYFEENLFSKSDDINTFKFYIEDANRIEDALLLRELVRRKLDSNVFGIFLELYLWFRVQLVVIYPDTVLGESYWRFNEENDNLVQLLQYFDTGISKYELRQVSEEVFRTYFESEDEYNELFNMPELNLDLKNVSRKGILRTRKNLFEIETNKNGDKKIYKLLFKHGHCKEIFEYGEESDGTRRLIELMDIIINAQSNKTYIIDELDRSLHPQMTRKFVETFFSLSKDNKTQLIITTHESNLMDLNILRRDEIWFAERDNDNSTKLFPLEMFKDRYDRVISKAYLSGRYGAVPIFRDFEHCFCEE